MNKNREQAIVMSAKEARSQTKPVDLQDAMEMINMATENQDSRVCVHPFKLIDEKLKNQLMEAGYKISYFTDGHLGLQGLLIEW